MTKREQLIFIGTKILAMQGTEQEIDTLMEYFDQQVPHPDGCNLFYYPENYKPGDDLSAYHPTVEAVVDQCLQYVTKAT
jgi:Colicin immunity protein / pyocin immunity protein